MACFVSITLESVRCVVVYNYFLQINQVIKVQPRDVTTDLKFRKQSSIHFQNCHSSKSANWRWFRARSLSVFRHETYGIRQTEKIYFYLSHFSSNLWVKKLEQRIKFLVHSKLNLYFSVYKSPIADEEKIDFCRSLYSVCNVALRMKHVVSKFLYLFITFFIVVCALSWPSIF